MKKLPELLCPCGSEESLKAAVLGGADAVYLGGSAFNARMNAKNFDDEALKRSVAYCHDRGVKVYVTLNTLVTDRQLPAALKFVGFLYSVGVDALIVADCGLTCQIRKYYPGFPIHASTQFSCHSLDGVRWLKDLGFERVVLARELSSGDLKTVCASKPCELEVFVHGALCASHSGQCLMSAFLGGRSGNKGECAQPCRMSYNGSHPLSLRDLCLAGHLTELVAMGVDSLKIEGRMKSPQYVYRVSSVYRRLLDEGRDAGKEDIRELAAVFSRGGFTDGYYRRRLTDMTGVRSEEDKQLSRRQKDRFEPVGAPKKAYSVKRAPVDAPEALILPPKPPKNTCRSARFADPASVACRDYFDIVYLPLFSFDPQKANGVVLPSVITDSEREEARKKLIWAAKNGAVHALVGNPGHLALLDGLGMTLHGDFRLNVQNSFAEPYNGIFEDIVVSPELNLAQIRDIRVKKSVIIYGRMPLMLLERRLGIPSLRDRTGATFPVMREGRRDLVLNAVPIYMADQKSKLRDAGIFNTHFIFTDETASEAAAVVEAYRRGEPLGKPVRRIK